MKLINQFLKNEFESFSESYEKIDTVEVEVEKLKNLFNGKDQLVNQTRYLKIQPKFERNQIWSIINEYDDFQGLTQKTSHPIIVIINKNQDFIEEESFLRVRLINPFIEMAAEGDDICEDPSIIGFPFLIETWNDQPVLSELLDEYLGYYEVNSEFLEAKDETLTPYQEEFRTIEISRAKYINHSVISLLSFLENRQTQDAGVVISMFGKPEYPKFYFDQTVKEPTLSLAAKSSIVSVGKYLVLDSGTIPFKIYIRKNEEGFIISVESTEKMHLFLNLQVEIVGTSYEEKTVFSSLKAGKYTLILEQFEEPIKIRLK